MGLEQKDSNKFISDRSLKGMKSVNWLGLKTLIYREIMRFLKIYMQTIIGPALTTLLFLIIFSVALGRASKFVGEVPFLEFLGPGLIIMSMIQNAFANSSSSLLSAKIAGNISDLLLPPLTALEFASAFLVGSISRGILVGIASVALLIIFVPIKVYDIFALIYFSIISCSIMGLAGLIAGIWADKFDQMAAITNFIITPLALLSGTFYSISNLPRTFYLISQFNPFFYMIDGFRYSLVGYSDASVIVGGLVLFILNISLFIIVVIMLKTGYKLKS